MVTGRSLPVFAQPFFLALNVSIYSDHLTITMNHILLRKEPCTLLVHICLFVGWHLSLTPRALHRSSFVSISAPLRDEWLLISRKKRNMDEEMRATSPSGWAGRDRLGATPSPTAGRILGEDPTVRKYCQRQYHAHRSAPRAPAQNSNMKRRAGNTEPQPKHQIPKSNHCACQYPYFRCRHSHVCRLRQ